MKPGPNEPCPCESGKKYKKCCWLKDREQEAGAALENRNAAAEAPPAPADAPKPKPPVPKNHSKGGMARSSAPRRRAI